MAAESIWPTDASRVVTSTFAEFRSTHFHAGIDINTDVTGYRVYAARSGYVSRISVSPNGYGKMLMVTHPDGYTTLYAHLSAFAGRIGQLARQVQDSLQRYPVRIECGPGQLPVERGEVIAYTGDTGVGTPHLHFEIRDEEGDPVNPLQCDNYQTVDALPPVISRVAVIPIGEGSTANGSHSPAILRSRGDGTRQVTIEGSAGLAVEARDPCNGTRFRRGAYRHTLYLDDREFFATSMDRVDGRYLQLVSFHYDWPLYYDHSGRFERLYVPDSLLLLSVRDVGPSNGILDASHLTPGTHRFRVVSEDYNGNRSEFSGSLRIVPSAVTGSPARPRPPYPILPGTSGRYVFDGGNLVVEYDSLSVFTPMGLEVEKGSYDGGASYTIGPPTTILREGLTVTLRSPAATASTGLFLRRRGAWSLIGRPAGDGTLRGTIYREAGEITAMADTTPPSISGLTVSVPRRGVPLITFRYSDDLSGIDYDELKVYLDGQAVIPEVDGEHRRVRYQSEQVLAYGTHHVSIRVKDRLGNLRTQDHRFVLR